MEKSFKSIEIKTDKSKTPPTISFDLETVKEHKLSAGIGKLVLHRAWVRGFFITLMIVIPLIGIVYGFFGTWFEN